MSGIPMGNSPEERAAREDIGVPAFESELSDCERCQLDECSPDCWVLKKKIRFEFEPFFKAMIDEMARHYPEKGFSWMEKTFKIDHNSRYSSMPSIWRDHDMVKESLIPTLKRVIEKWEEKPDNIGEYLDMAAMCGMIWWHVSQDTHEKRSTQ